MDQDLAALFQLLDNQLKKSNSEGDLMEFANALEKKYVSQTLFVRSLEGNAHVGFEEDKLGSALVPDDLPLPDTQHIFKAIKTSGNGDCLFNAASLALVGNESYATLLRLLVALELVLNVDFYAQHPKFSYFRSGGRHPNTVFSLCLTNAANNVFQDSYQNKTLPIRAEARTASTPREWSGYFHVAALSTVLARPVFSMYPNCQSWIRDFVHGIVYPRMATFSPEPVYLLWSREGVDNRPGAWYEPNHFVPLHLQKADGVDDRKGNKPVNQSGDCQIENESVAKVLQTKQKREDAKKTATVSEESQKKNSPKTSNKATKRGCLEQFGFRSQTSLLKKPKKEDTPLSESTLCEENRSSSASKVPPA